MARYSLPPSTNSVKNLKTAKTMSAFGTKRTSLVAPHMSAFGGKADIALILPPCPALHTQTATRPWAEFTDAANLTPPPSGLLIACYCPVVVTLVGPQQQWQPSSLLIYSWRASPLAYK